MTTRAATPLRSIARQLRYTSASPRTFVTAPKPKVYQTSALRSAATTTAAKSSTASSRTAPSPTTAKSSTTTKPPTKDTNPTPPASSSSSATHTPLPQTSGQPLPDVPASAQTDGATGQPIDWGTSYHGLGTAGFGPEVARTLQAALASDDIEVKPDGIIYLPEIKYRRVLNAAFGPGGWGLAPRSDLVVGDRIVYRDYALVAHGRFVAQARGEMQYFSDDGISTAAEGCKSNALMRCCKDLGIASELWDPRFIRKFMKAHAQQVWVEHVTTKKKKQIWLRKDDEVRYPFKKTT